MEIAIDKRILLRMRKELKALETSPPLGVVCYPLNDNIVHLQAEISGPEDTPYSTGTFKVDILIPDRYPFEPPRYDPLLVDVANEFKENRDLFLQKAKEYTERYATGSVEKTQEGVNGVENEKFIPSRACELQEQNSSTLSIADAHTTSLSTSSQAAFSSLAFSGSPLPQSRVHSGATEKKILKKPGLKKPSLRATRPTEETVSTMAAVMTPNVASSSSTNVHSPTQQGAAASDDSHLITATPVTGSQRSMVQPRSRSCGKSSESPLHPSAEDTVAATDLFFTHEDWKHDHPSHPSNTDSTVAADSTIAHGKLQCSQPSVQNMNMATDSQSIEGSSKREIDFAPPEVSMQVQVPKRIKHSKGILRSKPALPLAAPGTGTFSTPVEPTTPAHSVSLSVATSRTLMSRPEEVSHTVPVLDPSEHPPYEALTATPLSNPSCDKKRDSASSPEDKHRRASDSMEFLEPGIPEAADTDENAGAGSMSFYNQRDGGLHKISAGVTIPVAKAAPERNCNSTAGHDSLAPLTIARKRNLLKKHRS
ncbi:unnamed protein product [Mortierella alpina]